MQSLGKYWSTLLAHTDEELGIDSEFTRPGVEALLAQFKSSLDGQLKAYYCSPFTYTLHQAPAPAQSGSRKRKAADAAKA